MSEMTHWERIRTTIKGQKPDRIAVSMWRHFYDKETDPTTLAEAMLDFQRRYDWDFMKINARASYHMEEWDLKTTYNNDERPKTVGLPIKQPKDWLKLELLDPEKGVLGEHLKAIELIAEGLKGEIPFIMTVFTPPSMAAKLISPKINFAKHFRENYNEVTYALEIITETAVRFCSACLDRGVSGFFVPISAWATTKTITEEDYTSLAKPYDLRLLNTLTKAEFNMLHVCGDDNILHIVNDYPVDAFNWDALGNGNPSMQEGKALIRDKTAVGGMPQHMSIADYTPQQLISQANDIRNALGDKGWMLAPGCTFTGKGTEEQIRAIRQAVEK